MIIRPQKNFTIVRQIANHTDSGTYYVRAIIRNAYTDAIIDTLNLEDKGGQRFTKNWIVPADSSGLGFEISIVTSVYTDSGYTTKSENYGDEENSHIIEEKGNLGRGGGIDVATLRRVVKEEVEKAKPEPVKEKKELPAIKEPARWDEVIGAVKDLKTAISKIPTKIPEKTDLQPVIDGINALARAVQDKEVTPATDIAPILEKLEEVKTVADLNTEDLTTDIQAMGEKLIDGVSAEVAKGIASTKFIALVSTMDAPDTAKLKKVKERAAVREQPKEEAVPFDINQLAL